mmetsp:Transcript_44249/g.87300  ORF Transcript_44249/g.87300 Transcript_44249/m.87300 type:complete len:209 (-) Transcript_44249:2037-2663(-)
MGSMSVVLDRGGLPRTPPAFVRSGTEKGSETETERQETKTQRERETLPVNLAPLNKLFFLTGGSAPRVLNVPSPSDQLVQVGARVLFGHAVGLRVLLQNFHDDVTDLRWHRVRPSAHSDAGPVVQKEVRYFLCGLFQFVLDINLPLSVVSREGDTRREPPCILRGALFGDRASGDVGILFRPLALEQKVLRSVPESQKHQITRTLLNT